MLWVRFVLSRKFSFVFSFSFCFDYDFCFDFYPLSRTTMQYAENKLRTSDGIEKVFTLIIKQWDGKREKKMSKIHSVVEFRISSHAYAAADILRCLLIIFIMSMTGYGTQRENRRKKRTQHPVQTQKFRLHSAPAICLLIANRIERATFCLKWTWIEIVLWFVGMSICLHRCHSMY